MFEEALAAFWQEFGPGRKMVLSTARAGGGVSSRMMSVVQREGALYFQTDCAMRKYAQLLAEPHAALCEGNIQLEGVCRELGRPADCPWFCEAYRALYPGSYGRYTHLGCERLFAFESTSIERWLYIEGEPHVELFDMARRHHELRPYCP